VAGLFHAPLPVVGAAAGAAVLIVFKHLENLKRLARGEERRIGR
jgi:glycerol-3-phosphate acyltransferase PlsY